MSKRLFRYGYSQFGNCPWRGYVPCPRPTTKRRICCQKRWWSVLQWQHCLPLHSQWRYPDPKTSCGLSLMGTQGPWNRRHPLRDARRQVTCLCPESALLAHTKLWMAFWPLLTYNSTPHLKMDWNLGWFGLKIFFLKTELVSSTLRTVVIKFIYSPTRFF